ncbi:helix-turn-helix transcriptional regulator [Microbacterium sp. NPDC064978]
MASVADVFLIIHSSLSLSTHPQKWSAAFRTIVQVSALWICTTPRWTVFVTYPTREPNFEALWLALARLRQERGWSYDELAERSGVSRRTLIEMEHGQSNGRLESWFRIAEAFDVPLGDLVSVL